MPLLVSVVVSFGAHLGVDHRLNLKKDIEVSIKHVNGTTFKLKVNQNDTMEIMFSRIQAEENILVEDQLLFLKGKKLWDEMKTVEEYDIQDGDIIQLVARLNIIVRTLSGVNLSYEFQSCDTIDKIKSTLQHDLGYSRRSLRLVLRGKMLDDKCTLDHYKIRNAETLYLLIRSRA